MTIATNDLIVKFGTQTSVVSSGSLVSSTAMSIGADITALVNADDVQFASLVLVATFALATTAGAVVNIHARRLSVDGASSEAVPLAGSSGQYVGSFVCTGATSEVLVADWVALDGLKTSQSTEFYLENVSGQNMSAGWTLKATPMTNGPK